LAPESIGILRLLGCRHVLTHWDVLTHCGCSKIVTFETKVEGVHYHKALKCSLAVKRNRKLGVNELISMM